jgi:hypothetical protein
VPYLRLLACLVALGASFGVGLMLSPGVERSPAIATKVSGTSSSDCAPQARPATDGNCPALTIPGRDIEVIATHGAGSVASAETAPDAARAAEQQEAKTQHAAAAPLVPAPPVEAATPRPEATAPQVSAATAQPPAPATTARPPAQRTATTPEITPRQPAGKKSVRRDLAAKRPASEAVRAMRRFGDDLRDIPVSSYAADGTRRNIVIRPTNIQDVYYYSAPR